MRSGLPVPKVRGRRHNADMMIVLLVLLVLLMIGRLWRRLRPARVPRSGDRDRDRPPDHPRPLAPRRVRIPAVLTDRENGAIREGGRDLFSRTDRLRITLRITGQVRFPPHIFCKCSSSRISCTVNSLMILPVRLWNACALLLGVLGVAEGDEERGWRPFSPSLSRTAWKASLVARRPTLSICLTWMGNRSSASRPPSSAGLVPTGKMDSAVDAHVADLHLVGDAAPYRRGR